MRSQQWPIVARGDRRHGGCMIYVVVQQWSVHGASVVRAVAKSASDAHQLLRGIINMNADQGKECRQHEWSIWEYDLIEGLQEPVMWYGGTYLPVLLPFAEWIVTDA